MARSLISRPTMIPSMPTGAGGSRVNAGGQPLGGLGIFPPWVYPPANATNIFQSVSNQAIVGANTVLAPAALAFRVPMGRVAVVKWVVLVIQPLSLVTNVLWQLRVNGIPYPGLNALQIAGRDAANDAITIDDLAVICPENAIIDGNIIDVDGAAYQVGMQFGGWHWDKNSF